MPPRQPPTPAELLAQAADARVWAERLHAVSAELCATAVEAVLAAQHRLAEFRCERERIRQRWGR